MPTCNYTIAADAFDSWRDDVLCGAPPVLWPVGSGGLARLEIAVWLVLYRDTKAGTARTIEISGSRCERRRRMKNPRRI